MSYSTRAEVREMIKDDALNAIIGDTFIEEPAKREELVAPIIDAAIADADGEIDGYLAKRYAVPLAPVPKVINKFSKDIASIICSPASASTRGQTRRPTSTATMQRSSSSRWWRRARSPSGPMLTEIPPAQLRSDSPSSQTPGCSAGGR